MKSILTIGEILVEIMATGKGDGFLEPVNLVGPFPSGAPAIFIDQAAKFGQPAAIIGCVGNDDFGRVNLDRLRRDGVNVEGIRIDPELATGSAFVRYRPDGSRAFVYNIKHSASGSLVLNAAAKAVLERSDHLHVMGTALFSPSIVEIVLRATEAIKARGGTISFDPNLRPEILNLRGLQEACETLFRRCDVFLPSGAELYLFTDAKEEKAAVEEILAHGVKAIVHKRGVEGASYFDSAARFDQRAFEVEEVDPTGAGDCFGATFISCWLRNIAPAQCLTYAAASGALAVTRQGPMEGAASQVDLDAFLVANSRNTAT
jgi:tagatose kinase